MCLFTGHGMELGGWDKVISLLEGQHIKQLLSICRGMEGTKLQ